MATTVAESHLVVKKRNDLRSSIERRVGPPPRIELAEAIAEAVRRDIERRHGQSSGADSSNYQQTLRIFQVVDSFELPVAASQIGNRVRVIVVERTETGGPITPELMRAFGLTPREAEVALALATRWSSREIAKALGISQHTARRHVERVLEKLGVRSRRQVAEVLQVRNTQTPSSSRSQ